MNSQTEDKIREITDRIQDGVRSIYDSDHWKQYLATMAHFHHYSLNNSILIYTQMPEASYVAGFHTWKTHFHRYVKRGEKGIRILVPLKRTVVEQKDNDTERTYHLYGFRTASVFDISQTVGDPLPTYITDQLGGEIDDYTLFMSALSLISPVPVTFASVQGEAHGYYHRKEKKIVIDEDMSERMRVKTCIHEIAHALMHTAEDDRTPDFRREIEAESVAYAVCSYFDIDTSDYSFPYIAGWAASHDEGDIRSSLERIRSAADHIITEMVRIRYPMVGEHTANQYEPLHRADMH